MQALTISEAIMFTIGAMKAKHKLTMEADEAIDFAAEVESKLFQLELDKVKNKPIIETIEPKIITLKKV